MKSKKVIVLLISLTLLVSMTLPGRVVVSADQAADSGEMPLLSEDEGKDISPEGAGDPDSSGANQGGESSAPSGADQSGDSSAPSGADQGGDSSGSSGLNQSADPSKSEGTGNTGEQNLCTCGAVQGQDHKEGCPLYVAPDVIPTEPAKECTCGHEDGTHAENCPLYVAPEGLGEEEEEEEEERIGASLTVSVGADNGNAVLKLTGPEDYCKRIVVQGSGSVALSGLEAGAYTVSCGTDSQSITLGDGESGSLDITVTRRSHGWLTGEAYKKITFGS